MNLYTENGFTLLETLFSFAIFCLLVSFIPPLFSIMFHSQSSMILTKDIQKLEWEHFICQLKKEVQASPQVEVVNGSLLLFDGENYVTIHQYHNLLRRQLNGKGHEVLLQNVSNSFFTMEDGFLTLSVTDTYGEQYFAKIFPFIPFAEEMIDEVE